MIRLSQLTALDVESSLIRDLDSSPKLYCYRAQQNTIVNSLLLQESNSGLAQMTRNNALVPFWSNVLLGTQNFYPEQGLKLDNFHRNSEIHELLQEVSLPSVQYKKAFLYFSQGTLLNTKTKGYWIRIYCKLSTGAEVNLCSVVDFANDSNIVAKSSKLFESQVYNEALELQFLDIEFLLNSPSQEVQEIKSFLFGNETPTTYFVQYSEFTDEGIDEFTENGYSFTSLNFSVINEQSMPITLKNEELLSKIILTNNGYSLTSSIYHTSYNIEAYLNRMKNSDELYEVTHYYNIDEYNSSNVLISQTIQQTANPIDKFDQINFRPLINILTDHAKIELTIKIQNTNTGLTISRSSSIVITSDEVRKFMPIEQIGFNVTSHKIEQVIHRQVNRIVQEVATPKIIQIEKRTYVQAQQSNVILLHNAKMTIALNTSLSLANHKKLFLKIGPKILIENLSEKVNLFDIPQDAYLSGETQYLILDDDKKMISSGLLVRDNEVKLTGSSLNQLIKNQYAFINDPNPQIDILIKEPGDTSSTI